MQAFDTLLSVKIVRWRRRFVRVSIFFSFFFILFFLFSRRNERNVVAVDDLQRWWRWFYLVTSDRKMSFAASITFIDIFWLIRRSRCLFGTNIYRKRQRVSRTQRTERERERENSSAIDSALTELGSVFSDRWYIVKCILDVQLSG